MQSETSKCRGSLQKFCIGNGLDLGHGGDPIRPSAICIELPKPYQFGGAHPTNLVGDATKLFWFKDEVFDYVYSSHLLEDFLDTETVLREWVRVLRIDGRLVLYCPNEQRFRKHCNETGQGLNLAHKHLDFSLIKVREIIKRLKMKIILEQDMMHIYSWAIVAVKLSCKDST